jgi:hypothetical protein
MQPLHEKKAACSAFGGASPFSTPKRRKKINNILKYVFLKLEASVTMELGIFLLIA